MKNPHCCYMEGGSIINSHSGSIIENPALLADIELGCLYGWGEMDSVMAKFKKFTDAYRKTGDADITKSLAVIELSQYKISREEACYVLRRAVEYTATGFIEELYKQVTEGPDALAWLKSEMERVPISLEEKEWDMVH